MKRPFGSLAAPVLLAPLLLSLALGCGASRLTDQTGKTANRSSEAREEPLERALELFRNGDYREGLRHAGFALERDVKGRAEVKQEAAELAALKDRLGLDPDEVEEAADTTFRKMDAHHVEFCFQLRDVADSLQLQNLPPLQQAKVAFDWVVRQLLLRGGDEGLMPPQFALVRGEGNSHERALLFLELLRQMEIDGCMIALPGGRSGRPRYWLPGALIQEGNQAAVYLFDTRLGLPVPGPGGKGIATLAQVRTDPKLLEFLSPDDRHRYDVTFEQASQAEAHMVCPLTTLAPRMSFLEDRLASRDRVRLAMNPAKLLKRFEDVTGGKVQVWNRPSEQGKLRPNTPTRTLRLFLLPEEGGVPRPEGAPPQLSRLGLLREGQVPWPVILKNYRDMGVYDALPKDAQDRLHAVADRLFARYILLPQERLTHARFEEATRKLSHIREVIKEMETARLPKDVQAQHTALWVEDAKEAYLPWVRNPKGPAARERKERLWAEDQYLLGLLMDSDDEEAKAGQGPPDAQKKKALTFIVLGAMGEPLRDSADYLLALCWQEKAVRLQNRLEPGLPRASGDDDADRAAQVWESVLVHARLHTDPNPINQAQVGKRARSIVESWRAGARRDMGPGLWDHLFRNLRRSTACRLFYAHALRQRGKGQEAANYLGRLSDEIDGLQASAEVKAALAECAARTESWPGDLSVYTRAALQSLGRELAPGGGLAWMGHSALVQRQLTRLEGAAPPP